MLRILLLRTALGSLFGLVLCMSLHAQITGELRGTVVDPSGGAIAAAKISVKSIGTGEVREQMVNGQGEFSFGLLKVGSYEVSAEAAGFFRAVATAPVRT